MIDGALLGETLIIEFAFAVGLLGLFAVYMRIRSHNRDRRAAHALANKIRAEQNSRRKDIEKLVQKIMKEDASMAEALVAGIVRAEHDLYQAFLDSYILRTSESVDRLHNNVSEFASSYSTLIGHSTSDSKTADEKGATAEQASSIAKAEYEQAIKILEAKLEVSDQALNHVFREYAAMFGAGINGQNKLSAEEIMKRLDSGDLG